MRRLFRFLLIGVVGLAILLSGVLGAAAFYRAELAALAIRSQLTAVGFADAEFRVVRLDLEQAQIDGLSLSPGLPTVGEISVDYTLADLWRGQVAAIFVRDVAIDLERSAEDWARLRSAIDQEEDAAEARGIAFPPISFRNVSLRSDDPRWGPARLTLNADVTPAAGLSDEADDLPGGRSWRAEGTAALEGPVAAGRFTLVAASGTAAAQGGAIALKIGGAADIDAARASAPLGAGVASGELTLQLDLAAMLPADGDISSAEGSADVAATLRDATGENGAQASGAVGLRVEFSDRMLVLRLAPEMAPRLAVANARALEAFPSLGPEGVALTLETVEEDPLVALDWRGDFLEFAAAVALRGQSVGDEPPQSQASAILRAEAEAVDLVALFEEVSGSIDAAFVDLVATPTDDVTTRLDTARWDAAAHWRAAEEGGGALFIAGPLSANGDLVAPGVDMRGAALDGEIWVNVDVAPDGTATWSSHPQPALMLTAEQVSVADRLELSGPPLVFGLEFGEVAGDADGIEIAARGSLSPSDWSLSRSPTRRVPFEDVASTFELEMAAPADGPMRGRIRLDDARLRAPEWGVRFSGLDADFPLDPFAPEVARAALSGLVEDLAAPARFASAAVQLDATRDASAWRASGSVAAPTAGLRAPVSASYDLTRGDVQVRIGPAPLRFRRGGPPPSALSSMLAPINQADGRAVLDVDLRVDAAGRLRASGRLEADGLDLDLAAARVEGLRGDIRIADLLGPRTREPQTIEIDRVDPGAAIEDVMLTFGLARGPGGAPLLALERLTAAVAEGRVGIADADIPLDGSPFDLDIDVARLSLKALIEELSIANLRGDGRLTGRIPLRVSPEGLVIDKGRLASDGPGVVQVDWGDARAPLMSQGEEVGWLVRALEDFRYQALSVGLERPTNGALSLALSLSGSNPDVLDDQPFNFNINVRGDLEPILEAVRDGRRIGSDLLQGRLQEGLRRGLPP